MSTRARAVLPLAPLLHVCTRSGVPSAAALHRLTDHVALPAFPPVAPPPADAPPTAERCPGGGGAAPALVCCLPLPRRGEPQSPAGLNAPPGTIPTAPAGRRARDVCFIAAEGTWLCRNSRACIRRHWQQQAEADAESARWELREPGYDEDDLPF